MRQQSSLGPRISIVVPALDAATSVYFVLRQLPDADEVILVDGGSVDGTPDAARQARPDVKVLLRSGVSRAAALAAGIEHATGDVIITLPIDGSADPEEVPAFVAALTEGADVVKGSRYAGSGNGPSVADRALAWLGRRLHGAELSDLGYGFYGFWADQRDLLALPIEERGSWVEHVDVAVACQLARAGARIVEVPSRRMAPLFGNDELRGTTSFIRSVRAVFAERRRARAHSDRSRAREKAGVGDPEHSLV
jgi:glycosyltransferase involved in cell wall biosynthesis